MILSWNPMQTILIMDFTFFLNLIARLISLTTPLINSNNGYTYQKAISSPISILKIVVNKLLAKKGNKYNDSAIDNFLFFTCEYVSVPNTA